MKKITSTDFKPFILYKEDLEELANILPAENTTITYKCSSSGNDLEYSYDSIGEMIADLEGQEISDLEISYYESSFKLYLGGHNSSIKVNDDGNYETLGKMVKIQEICSRHPWKMMRFLNIDYVNLYLLLSCLLVLGTYQLVERNILPIYAIFIAFIIMATAFIAWGYSWRIALNHNKVKYCFYESNRQDSFLKSIIVKSSKYILDHIFAALIGSVVTLIITYLLKI